MNVFVDFVGHADLYYSMHLLFEKQLGYKLYRPLPSEEWSAHEIITTPTMPPYVTEQNLIDDVVHFPMGFYNYDQKAITFKQFLDIDFDILITTASENERPFYNLVKNYKPTAAFVRQIANIHERPKQCRNILLSTTEPMPKGVQWIKYHPEHLSTYFPADDSVEQPRVIKSFFNYMPSFPEAFNLWNQYKVAMPDFDFKMHGGGSHDGSIPPIDLPDVMRDGLFIWHAKPHGGCGYVARQALSSGKPLIVNKAFAKRHNTLAVDYMVDGVNCIDISPGLRPVSENAAIIREWSRPEVYKQKAAAAAATFPPGFFEQEAQSIKAWLNQIPRGV